MGSRKNNRVMALLIIDIFAAIILWALLIILKAAGAVDNMHWALVLSSLVWLSWLLFAITGLAEAIKWGIRALKRRYRRRKIDRRIIRQAKAAGVWDRPSVLGGRALELKVWEDFKIKRQKGETDAELRRRYVKEGRKRYLPNEQDGHTGKGESVNG